MNSTKKLQQKFRWEAFDHPPYSPNLAPSDLHLFLHAKKFLSGHHFPTDEDTEDNCDTLSPFPDVQTTMTPDYKNLSHGMTKVSIPVVLMLRSS